MTDVQDVIAQVTEAAQTIARTHDVALGLDQGDDGKRVADAMWNYFGVRTLPDFYRFYDELKQVVGVVNGTINPATDTMISFTFFRTGP